MVFEAPLATYVNGEGRDVQIVAISWGPWGGPCGRWDQGGIWLSFFSHPAPVLPTEAFTSGIADRAALAPLMSTVPPVLPDNEAGWPFGDLPGNQEIPEGTTATWALATRAAWRLMASPSPRKPPSAPTAPPARASPARASPLPTSGVIHIRRAQRSRQPSASGNPRRVRGPVVGRRSLAHLLVRARPTSARGPLDRSLSCRARR